MKKDFISIDLETLGTTPGSAILSIGAAAVTNGKLAGQFYCRASIASNEAAGLTLDGSTVLWWLRQSQSARDEITGTKPTETLKRALDRFALWLEDYPKRPIWGNGSDFDNALLAAAYQRTRRQVPWAFWQNRCLRTLKNEIAVPEPRRRGTHHNALDDAIHQARHLIAIAKTLNP